MDLEQLEADIYDLFNTFEKPGYPLGNLEDFDKVKDKIFYKLVNYDKNLDTLKSDSYVEKLIESNSPHLLDYAYQAFENDALSLYAKLLLMPGKKSIHYKMKRIIRSEIICRCSKVILSKKCKIKVKLKLIFAIAVPNFYAFIYWLWRLLFRFNLYEIWLKLFCIH